eukprot:GEMP01032807.1.p1 GENE.GEMP01032807.1~~GEMP01032807.1.p1  ORF type:complete len:421 (+),score=29.78 GEMP01032807.1:120-1382(+)
MASLLVLATCAFTENLAIPEVHRNLVMYGHDSNIVPWQVRAGGCGGTIISPTIIMTAAHCKKSFKLWNFVYAGFTDSSNKRFAQKRQITQLILDSAQPFQEKPRLTNDIMLVRIDSPWKFNSKVGMATLPSQGYFVGRGHKFEVTGWGYTQQDRWDAKGVLYGPKTHSRLQKATVTYSPCYDKSADQFCAGGWQDGYKQPCMGDSGGPLVLPGTSIVVGIVSWGAISCNGNDGARFTKVSQKLRFIEQHVQRSPPPSTTHRPISINPSTRKPFIPSTPVTRRPRPQPPTHRPQPGGGGSCADSQPAAACAGWAAQGQCEADVRMRTSWCKCTCAKRTRSAGATNSNGWTTEVVCSVAALCVVIIMIAIAVIWVRRRSAKDDKAFALRVQDAPVLTWGDKDSSRRKTQRQKNIGTDTERRE